MKRKSEKREADMSAATDPEMSRRLFLEMAVLSGGTLMLGPGVIPGAHAAHSAAHTTPDLKGRQMVFASWGGVYQDAQKTSYCDPFANATGVDVVQDGPASGAKLRTMVETGAPIWDVVDVTDIFLYSNSGKNLFEKIDTSIVDTSIVDPNYLHPYGVGCIVWSYNIGWNKNTFPGENRPRSWADVFDTRKFPGKRMLRDRIYPMMEVALLADGVPLENLYPLDIDRAFRKLDTIKDDVVWWNSNSQSQQLLTDGAVGCGLILNGRAYDLVKKNGPVGLEWNQNIQSADFFSIPRGAKNADVAQYFMNYMTTPENQATMANTLAYSPVNPAAFSGIEDSIKPWLSTNPDNAKQGIVISGTYWQDRLEGLTERWNEWKLS